MKSEIAAQIITALTADAAEVMAPLTIMDIFFLYERDTMAIYTFVLSVGVRGGIIISGLIAMAYDSCMIYSVATALIAACTFLVIFALPDTAYP